MGFVDLHTHVLPGLDDGAPDAATSSTMIRALAGIGFTQVYATPHQKSGHFMPSRQAIDDAYRKAATTIPEGLTLGLGAENMWDDVFYERYKSETIPGYDDGPAFLVEFPLALDLPANAREVLFQLRLQGKLPVLAHPERYPALGKDSNLAESIAQVCAMCVDLGAIAGYHGRARTKLARKLLKQGHVHAVATDSHTVADVQAAAEGIAWLRKKYGASRVSELLDQNPRAILRGEHPGN